jgi:amino-acid N-acetyltransferase
MESHKLKEQVELIREVFEYIHRFQGKTFVIKIDCSVMDRPFFPLLLRDLVLLHRQGIRIVLVPGATQRIDEILTRYGIKWETVEGVRVSTAEAIPFIKMAAFDASNRLMTQLAANDADGVIGNWVKARSLGVRKGVDFQHTGAVERIEVDIVRKVLAEGLVPILPNIGWNAAGTPYNVSSNELACVVGRTLAAEKLFFISDHRGVIGGQYKLPRRTPLSEEGVVTHLSVVEAQKLLDLNPVVDPMLSLVRVACQACQEGVSRVHIVNGEIEGVVLKEIFSSVGCGTMVYANQHENVRAMRRADISEVLRIMRPFIEKEVLVERSEEDLAARLGDYVVYEVDGLIHACGALHRSAEDPQRAEVAAVAVDETYAGFGIGRRIVSFLLERAREQGLRQLYVLTTQTADWFVQFGFREGGVEDLPEARRRQYNRQRNSRVLLLDVETAAEVDTAE